MTPPARAEGKLDIALELSGPRQNAVVSAVDIRSSRPLRASQLFVGKTAEQCLQLLPLLFNICARAQSCAAVRAIEGALGLEPNAEVEAGRQALVDMESLREHLWRIFLDWPGHFGAEPDRHSLAQVLKLQQQFEGAMVKNAPGEATLFCPGTKPVAIDQEKALAAVNALRDIVESTVLNGSCRQWSSLADEKALGEWLQRPGGGTALLKYIVERGWRDSGHCNATPLPEFDTARASLLADHMQRWDFIAQPTWQGQCRETSSLQRNPGPLPADIRERGGNGLLARAAALVGDVVRLLQRLGSYVSGEREEAAGSNSYSPKPGQGLGMVSAARGQLIHWLQQEGNILSDYRILAPTEWNFHPRGSVAGGLQSLRGSVDSIRQQAALLIELADPCVGYQLSLREGDAANA